MAWASWRQISDHHTPAGTWCRWSEVTVREGAPYRGCPDHCPTARVEQVHTDTPWPDSVLTETPEAAAC